MLSCSQFTELSQLSDERRDEHTQLVTSKLFMGLRLYGFWHAIAKHGSDH